jgi:hypothetical protein
MVTSSFSHDEVDPPRSAIFCDRGVSTDQGSETTVMIHNAKEGE